MDGGTGNRIHILSMNRSPARPIEQDQLRPSSSSSFVQASENDRNI